MVQSAILGYPRVGGPQRAAKKVSSLLGVDLTVIFLDTPTLY